MGKFVKKKGANDQYYFSLKAGNGESILRSEGYTTEAACDNGIESVKKNAVDASKFDKKTSTNGKYYFNLKAGNGQIIGTSEMYETQSGCDNGVASVMKNAPDASVVSE